MGSPPPIEALPQDPQVSPVSAEEPKWPASAGLMALVLGLVGGLVLIGVIAGFFAVLGGGNLEDNPGFLFSSVAAQDLAFVAAALVVAAGVARPSAAQFGFRVFRPSALGWALLALVVYFVLSAVYVSLANPPADDLPQQLGADRSTTLAIITGIFVIVVAPPVEEFFFRGFLYQALRNRFGIVVAAVLSGFIFGAIHLKVEFLVPLAILGTVLALLFQKTNSLWPCILVHAANNSIALAVAL